VKILGKEFVEEVNCWLPSVKILRQAIVLCDWQNFPPHPEQLHGFRTL